MPVDNRVHSKNHEHTFNKVLDIFELEYAEFRHGLYNRAINN